MSVVFIQAPLAAHSSGAGSTNLTTPASVSLRTSSATGASTPRASRGHRDWVIVDLPPAGQHQGVKATILVRRHVEHDAHIAPRTRAYGRDGLAQARRAAAH